jgi:hypothetical protein
MATVDDHVIIDLTDDANDGLIEQRPFPNAIPQPGPAGPSIPDVIHVKRQVREMFFDICPLYLDGLSKSEAAMFLQGDALLDFLVTKIVEQNGLYPKADHDRLQLAGTKRKGPGENSPLNTNIVDYSKWPEELGIDFDAGLNNELLCEPLDAAPRM